MRTYCKAQGTLLSAWWGLNGKEIQKRGNKYICMADSYCTLLYSTNCHSSVKRLCVCVGHSVVSNPLQPHEPHVCQAPLSMNSPGKNIGVGSHSLLQGIFLTNDETWVSGIGRQILYHLSHQGSPVGFISLVQSLSRI